MRILLVHPAPTALWRQLTETPLGLSVDTADTVDNAVAHGRVHEYDAVICDLRMPPTSGIATVARLRELFGPDAPMVFITKREISIHVVRQAGGDSVVAAKLLDANIDAIIGVIHQAKRHRDNVVGMAPSIKDPTELPATPEPTGEAPAPAVPPVAPTTPQAMLYSLIVNKYVSTTVVSIVVLMGASEYLYGERIDRWLDVQEETAEKLGERVAKNEAAIGVHAAADAVHQAEVTALLLGMDRNIDILITQRPQ